MIVIVGNKWNCVVLICNTYFRTLCHHRTLFFLTSFFRRSGKRMLGGADESNCPYKQWYRSSDIRFSGSFLPFFAPTKIGPFITVLFCVRKLAVSFVQNADSRIIMIIFSYDTFFTFPNQIGFHFLT